MHADLRITNARVLTPQGVVHGGVAIASGRIVAIAHDTSLPIARDTIDAGGHHLLPGLVDAHVHFRDPGLTDKEDFTTGSRAAVRGGVTTVLDMPNTLPPVETGALLSAKVRHLAGRSLAHYGLFAAITANNQDRIEELAEAGAIAYKVFLGPSTGDLSCPDDGDMLEVLGRVRATGRPFAVHAENHHLVTSAIARLRAAGRTDPLAHAEARPVLAEVESIQRMILFARATGVALHVVHLSSGEGVALVRRAKGDGVRVTAETCPHHLLLTAADMERIGPASKMNPPLRGLEDVEALWDGLGDGTIDFIATDHAPHTLEEKTRPVIWDNASGASTIQWALPLMLTQVARGRLGLTDLVRLMAEAPARCYGLYPRKGVIAVGSDADLVLVDLEEHHTVRAADMENKVKLTPFEGVPCVGRPLLTLVAGTVAARAGTVVGAPGIGAFLRPS